MDKIQIFMAPRMGKGWANMFSLINCIRDMQVTVRYTIARKRNKNRTRNVGYLYKYFRLRDVLTEECMEDFDNYYVTI